VRLPRFEYFEPRTIEEACALLLKTDAKILAGGTELLVHMKQRTLSPEALVNIKSIPGLRLIEETTDGGLSDPAPCSGHLPVGQRAIRPACPGGYSRGKASDPRDGHDRRQRMPR